MCAKREGRGGVPDVAFKISQRAVASIPTANLFPDGFPPDFSILTTFRTSSDTAAATKAKGKRRNTKATLFSIYNSEGTEVLSLKIARRLR